MPSTQEEKLRHDFRKKFWDEKHSCFPILTNVEDMEDYWLKVLAEHHREWVESVRKEMAEIRDMAILLQKGLCLYRTCEGDGMSCDCKCFADKTDKVELNGSGERSGCCHARKIIWAVDKILPSLSLTNSKVCGALIHTRGLDGKGLYCASPRPCKLHSKSK